MMDYDFFYTFEDNPYYSPPSAFVVPKMPTRRRRYNNTNSRFQKYHKMPAYLHKSACYLPSKTHDEMEIVMEQEHYAKGDYCDDRMICYKYPPSGDQHSSSCYRLSTDESIIETCEVTNDSTTRGASITKSDTTVTEELTTTFTRDSSKNIMEGAVEADALVDVIKGMLADMEQRSEETLSLLESDSTQVECVKKRDYRGRLALLCFRYFVKTCTMFQFYIYRYFVRYILFI